MTAGPVRCVSVVAVILGGLVLAGCSGGHSHAPTAVGTTQTQGSGTTGGAGSTAGAGAGSGGSGAGAAAGSVGSTGGASVAGTGGTVPGEYGFPVGPLLPTVVEGGECQAAQFKDGSVYAQIAIFNTPCTQVPSVTADADKAQGKQYSAAGFACSSVAQPAGGTYWKSPFFSYHCQNGDQQIAFNWGTSSTAF